MLVKIFSLMAGGRKEKAVEVMGAWKTQPSSVWSLCLALDCSFVEQQSSAGKGEATSNQHDIAQAGWEPDINDPHGSTFFFSEQVLKKKTPKKGLEEHILLLWLTG